MLMTTIANQIETALNTSLGSFRMLVEANIVGIATGDENTITDSNNKFLSIVGYTRDDLLHGCVNWRAMAAPDSAQADESAYQEMLESGSCKPFEKVYVRKDGTFATTLVGAALTTRDPIGWISFVLDLSERKQFENRIAALYEREHRISETLQATLITQTPHRYPGVEVDTAYQPALDEAEVGGDYFDVFPLGDGKLALVVGDVSGKGLEAATHTAEIKFALRAYLREHQKAGKSLTLLNSFLCKCMQLEPGTPTFFVVMGLVILDLRSGVMEVAVGGTEPVLIVRVDKQVEALPCQGMALGILVGEEYEALTLRLNPGDIIVMATDGITELRKDGVFLGSEGLAQLVCDAAKYEGLHNIRQAVLDGVYAYSSGKRHDDICLLLARLNYNPPE